MKRVSFQEAYVLHRRAYRETSFLVDVFTPEFGRLTVLARGVRKSRSAMPGLLQPFMPLRLSWSGRGELVTLVDVEANGPARRLHGDSLFSGFYLNELLSILLQKWDAHADLYWAYDTVITQLEQTENEERLLRQFEKVLLEEIGYGLLPKDHHTMSEHLKADKIYRFVPEQGFVEVDDMPESELRRNEFSGASLLSIASDNWENEVVLKDAKRLTRLVLLPLLGNRQINSRRLFTMPEEEKS